MSTYLWSDAVTVVRAYTQGIPTSTLDAAVCDSLNGQVWRYAFWRWSVVPLTPILLEDAVQDYTVANSNFYRPLNARLTRTDITPHCDDEKDLVDYLSPNLNTSGGLYSIRAVSFFQRTISAVTTTTVRLDSAASVPSGTTIYLNGDYQFLPTKITVTTTATIAFPDHHIDVAIEGLKWKYMSLAKDPRAGTMTTDKLARRQYTGQLGSFMQALDEMREAEDLGNGQATRFPDMPLGAGRYTYPGGIFGW
jgi:hypothetical protein